MEVRKAFHSFIITILDSIFPPQCISCQAQISHVHSLCPTCWGNMTFISAPFCKTCGVPFPTENEGDMCMYCMYDLPSYSAVRSVVRFDDSVANMVHALKYYDKTELVPAMAKLMFQYHRKIILSADIICPIPLHINRLRKRKFNQSLLLAGSLARLCKIRLIPDLLVRIRDIPSQSGLNRAQRFANVNNAFEVNKVWFDEIPSKKILIVDDVITTGATLNECALSLKPFAPISVLGLSFARSY